MSFAYSPSLVLVGQYFKKYRGIACGIGTSGAGLGAFSMPPMVDALFGYYGYMGTFLILGAFMSNICIAGALHRPLEENTEQGIENHDCMISVCLKSHGNNAASDTRKDRKSNGCDLHNESKTDDQSDVQKMIEPLTADCNPSSNSETISSVKSGIPSKSNIKYDDIKGERSGPLARLNKYIDISLCYDRVFLIIILGLSFHSMAYVAAQILLPALSKNRGYTDSASVFLISVLGISEMCGRFVSGFIFDAPFFRKHQCFMYMTSIVLVAFTEFLWAFCQSYEVLLIASVIHGVFNGFVVSQRVAVLADLLGVEKLSSSVGFTFAALGLGSIIGPPFAGNCMFYQIREAKT